MIMCVTTHKPNLPLAITTAMPMPDTNAFISRLRTLSGFDGKLANTPEDTVYIPLADLHAERDELLEWEVADPGDEDTPPLTPCISEKSLGKMPESSPLVSVLSISRFAIIWTASPKEEEVEGDDEWYGMEYSLQLSVSEKYVTGVEAESSVGESSKVSSSMKI